MRHIEIKGFAEPPCHGTVIEVVPSADPRRLRLPIIGRPAHPDKEWRCERCGQHWTAEPQPEEAL